MVWYCDEEESSDEVVGGKEGRGIAAEQQTGVTGQEEATSANDRKKVGKLQNNTNN